MRVSVAARRAPLNSWKRLQNLLGAPLLPRPPRLVSFQMRVDDSQQRLLAWLFAATLQQIADNMVGLDRGVLFYVTKHGSGERRRGRRKNRPASLNYRLPGWKSLACRNAAALIQQKRRKIAGFCR